MKQATACTREQGDLADALYAVLLRLRQLPTDPGLDKGALTVLHETHRMGAVRPSDLAAELRLDLSTVSRHLSHLEAEGLVERSPDPGDARAQRISITPAGQDLLAHLLDQRAAHLRDATQHWPAQDRRTLRRLLQRLAVDLHQENE